MNLTEKILFLRKKQGMSQEELAEKMNVSRQSVSRWEVGTAWPDATNILQLSKIFGVTTDYLLNDDYESDEDIPCVKEVQDSQKKKNIWYRILLSSVSLLLIMTILCLFAACGFLGAGIDNLDIGFVMLAIVIATLAGVCFVGYYKLKR